jgi:transcriptional regulator with XRE-family HTH domain
MDVRRLVGRNLSRLRKEKGCTQEGLAELSGHAQQYISDIERGLVNVTVITLFELAHALEVMLEDLVRVDEEAEKECARARKRRKN